MKLSEYLKYADCSCKLLSDGEFEALEQCTRIRGEQALTFLESPKYAEALNNPQISCVICTQEVQNSIPAHIQGIVITDTPRIAFFRIHNALYEQRELKPTVIDPSAKISPLAYVAPYDVVIGKNVVIDPFTAINEGAVIDDDVWICSHCVIAARGFATVNIGPEEAFIVQDAGITHIEEGVRVGTGNIIERGTLFYDKTVVGAYSMLASQVVIGHGSKVGKRCVLTGRALIPGNTTVGDRVYLGLNATLSNALTIGDNARVSLGSVVTRDVPAGETVTGNFAIPHQRFMKNLKESIKE